MWKSFGLSLWLPTAVNAYLLAEIIQLSWERSHGVTNTAQGDLEIAIQIMTASVPISICFLIGFSVFAVMRTRVPRDPESKPENGCMALAMLNLLAPALLYFGLRWTT